MVMARELYALLMLTPFHLPNDPGNAAIYVRLVMAGQPVNAIKRMEQTSIDTHFACANITSYQCTTSKGCASQPSMQVSMTH
jgi:hypothetical protein